MTGGIFKKIVFGAFLICLLVVPNLRLLQATEDPLSSKSAEVEKWNKEKLDKEINDLKVDYSHTMNILHEYFKRENVTALMIAEGNRQEVKRGDLENKLRSLMPAKEWRDFYETQPVIGLPSILTGVYINGQKDNNAVFTQVTRKDNKYVITNNPNFADTEFTLVRQSNGTYEVAAERNTKTGKETDYRTGDERIVEAERLAKERAEEAKQKSEEEVKIVCPDAGWNFGALGEVLTCIVAKVSYFWILTFANYVLSLISSLFNSIMELAVSNMGETLGLCRTAGEKCVDVENNVIDIGWTLFRDITNLLLIFVLVYAAIRTILGGLADTGRTIAAVIAVGVLINFSMFFTKVIVDISNTLSTSFYNSIITFNENEWKKVQEEGGIANMPPFDEKDVIGPMVAKSNVISIVGQVKEVNNTANSPLSYTMVIKQSLIGTAFIAVLIGTILIMSVMLLARVLILGFIIMTSAIAVGSFILPEFKKAVFDKWFPALLGQAFFAPVFILFLYVSLRFVSEFKNNGSTTDTASLANLASSSGIASATQGIIQFVLVIGMFIISLKVAQIMASKAGGAAGKVTSILGTATLGAVGLAGKLGLGGFGHILSKVEGDDAITNGARRFGGFLANRTYDPRNIPGMGYLGEQKVGSAGTETSVAEYFEKKEKEKKKSEDEQLKKQSEGYKEAGKIKPEEQLVININDKRRTLNKTVVDISYKKEKDINAIKNNSKLDNNPTERKRQIDQVEKRYADELEKAKKDLKKHVEKHKDKYGDDLVKSTKAIEDAAKAITGPRDKKQEDYIKSRRSKYGKRFAVEEMARQEKVKKPDEETINAIKGINVGGGGESKGKK